MNLRGLALAAGLGLAGSHAPAGVAGDATPLPPDSVYHVDATLAPAGGGSLEWQSLRGKPRVVTMFYSTCRAVCPMIVESARAVQRSLPQADRSRVGFVLITMDPKRDSPATLAEVQTARHLDSPGWLLLQPREQDVRTLAAILGVRYRQLADGEFNHTTTLVLLDAEGRVLARTENIGAAGDKAFTDAVRVAAAGVKPR
jgi:protein SCO1/2